MKQQPRRNDPCRCGSARKFKHCCGKAETFNRRFSSEKSALIRTTPNQSFQACIEVAEKMRRSGRLAECILSLQQAAQIKPRVAVVHYDLGRIYLDTGQILLAVESLQKAADLKPRDANIHFYLGLAQERRGSILTAIEELKRSAKLDPKIVEVHAKLAQLLLVIGDRKAALASYRRANIRSPKSEIGQICLARALIEENKTSEAEELLRETIVVRHPDSGVALGLLGRLYVQAGRFDEAEPYFLRAIEKDPQQVHYYYDLVRGRKLTDSDQPLVQGMRDALDARGLSDQNRYSINLAIGKAVDDLGEPGEAMRYWREANLAKSRISSFDQNEYSRRIEPITTVFKPELFSNHANLSSKDPTPILIIGMPRSGTTLVDQILSSHPDVEAAGELGYWSKVGQSFLLRSGKSDSEFLQKTAKKYVEQLRESAPNAKHATDKMPQNFLWVGLIHLVFPNAKFIHCYRNTLDNCLSIFSTYFGPKPDFSTDPKDLAFYYQEYLKLMDHWHTVIPNSQLLDIKYENLIANPELAIRGMVSFCGLDWDPVCLHPEHNSRVVKTASSWQVRQPINAGSVARWKRYEPWLEQLAELFPPEQ